MKHSLKYACEVYGEIQKSLCVEKEKPSKTEPRSLLFKDFLKSNIEVEICVSCGSIVPAIMQLNKNKMMTVNVNWLREVIG